MKKSYTFTVEVDHDGKDVLAVTNYSSDDMGTDLAILIDAMVEKETADKKPYPLSYALLEQAPKVMKYPEKFLTVMLLSGFIECLDGVVIKGGEDEGAESVPAEAI